MKNTIKKIIASVSLIASMLVSIAVPVCAASFTSAYPKITSHDIDGGFRKFSNYTRAAYLCEADPAGESVRLKWADDFDSYIVNVKLLSGNPSPGSNFEAGTLLKSVTTQKNYITIPDIDQYEGKRVKEAS